jgi:hypothetical protein
MTNKLLEDFKASHCHLREVFLDLLELLISELLLSSRDF